MARSHDRVPEEVAEHLREKGNRSEFEAVLEGCASGNVHLVWRATAILRKPGRGPRRIVDEFLRKTEEEEAREALLRALESRGTQPGEGVDRP